MDVKSSGNEKQVQKIVVKKQNGKRELYCEPLGKNVVLPEKCEKIASFSPSVTEALFEMGLGDKVVGVSVWCVRPPEARQKVILGSYSTAKMHKLEELSPDIIFTTSGYQIDFAKKLSEKFPTWAVSLPTTVSEIISTCEEVGLVVGYYEKARQLAESLYEKLFEVISLAKQKRRTKRPKVYVEIDLGGPVTFGAFSYITDAIYLVGGKNVFEDEPKEWLKPDDRKVIESNPDIIIYEPKMFSRHGRSPDEVREKLERRFGRIKALENLFITPGIYDFLAHHGPDFIKSALPWLYKVVNSV